jgi:hypothetical protein
MRPLCIVDVNVTVNNVTILAVAQKWFNGEFMSPKTIKPTWVFNPALVP